MWNDTMFQIVIDANSTSAQGVQDDGEGYNKVLIWLSAEDKMQIEGWSRTSYFEVLWYYKYMSVQIFENIQKKVMWKLWTKV